jgi:hypothetical protein
LVSLLLIQTFKNRKVTSPIAKGISMLAYLIKKFVSSGAGLLFVLAGCGLRAGAVWGFWILDAGLAGGVPVGFTGG